MKVQLYNGDNIAVLSAFEDNSIDSIVTDPPYGLSFMNKKWDYDVPSVELWQECLRVLKPGGHLLAACGTRTQHRMATNIEDAGFEIRDLIAWIYGSGFPKSLNIGKAIDKLLGNERDFIRDNTNKRNSRSTIINVQSTECIITKGTSEFEGWGTALKPAMELWTMARKPISEKNIAENVLRWHTGGINIDGCRVETDDKMRYERKESGISNNGWVETNRKEYEQNSLGRFPANLIHDGSEEVVAGFPEQNNNANYKFTGHRNGGDSLYSVGISGNKNAPDNYGDSGSASRFFYTAKAHSSERNYGLEGFEEVIHSDRNAIENIGANNPRNRTGTAKTNYHPTVKPLDLMQYLVRLVTPKGGVCLDAFMGSGTTGMACKLEHFDFIGIELDPEYFKIAKARIDAVGEVTEIRQNTDKLF